MNKRQKELLEKRRTEVKGKINANIAWVCIWAGLGLMSLVTIILPIIFWLVAVRVNSKRNEYKKELAQIDVQLA